MVRLPNDCFANAEEMLSVEEARSLIAEATTRISQEDTVDITVASGRILAQDVHATLNVPPNDNSAVDGFAFAFSDYEHAKMSSFKNVGTSAAGVPFEGTVAPGQCIKIFTGAVMPADCDTVAMVEDILEHDVQITLPRGLKQGANRRFAGEDIKKGCLLLAKGCRIRPQELGYLASIGMNEIPVFKRLKVALVSTGDELTEPGDTLSKGGIYDSNRYTLRSMLEKFGCEIDDYGVVRDTLAEIRDTLLEAEKNCDLIVTSGGVSMGDEDHVKAAVEETGSLHFWRIAIKPGRPLALGQVQNTAFVGLPGNPVAAFVCLAQLIRPMIARLSGEESYKLPNPILAKSAFSMQKKAGRREWMRGRYKIDDSGQPVIEKYPVDGSGIVSSLVWANGLIELDEPTTEINKGDPLKFFLFSELFE